MTAVFDGAGLVDADVAALGGNNCLIGPQEGGDGGGVHLGAPHQEVDGGLRRGAQTADGVRRHLTAGVAAIARAAYVVYLGQSLPYRRMGPGTVIIAEVDHIPYLSIISAPWRLTGATEPLYLSALHFFFCQK